MSGIIIGGLIALAYAALAGGAELVATRSHEAGRRHAWRAAAVLAFLLAMAKLARIEPLVAEHVRRAAEADGWYAGRGIFQNQMIVLVMFGAIVGLAAIWIIGRRIGARTLTALLVLTGLIGFAGVRAVSLHRIDHLVTRGIGPLLVSHVIELAGIAVVALLIRSALADRRG